jgi:tetratricopeptide (TPR) repeat protein
LVCAGNTTSAISEADALTVLPFIGSSLKAVLLDLRNRAISVLFSAALLVGFLPARIIRDIPMTDQNKSRRQKLEEYLAKNPNDAFSRYGVALECVKEGDLASAETHFQKLIETNPDYVPGYQMYAQTLAQNERGEEAKAVLTRGIQAAIRQGNQHARSEMEALLADLG